MLLADFEAMVRRQSEEIPAEFMEGIAEIVVSPRTVAHPDRDGIWTLGECIPLPTGDSDPRHLQSRVVLYHGSFQALAHDTPGFDWRNEAWETLTHEIRHHVEWKAHAPDLEAQDEAVEANFARQDGEPFDPSFYQDGLKRPDGSWQVEDDVFVEQVVGSVPEVIMLHWQGEDYEVPVPEGTDLPAYLTVTGVTPSPGGDLVVVLQKKGGWLGVFRRPRVFRADVRATRLSR